MTALVIKNLDIKINNNTIINGINLSIFAGEIYSLIGQNGSGKTSFLKTLAGLLPLAKEQIFLCKQDLASFSLNEKARNISLLLQHCPFEPYTLGIDRIAHGLLAMKDQDQAIFNIVDKLNIKHILYKPLMHMSGGERRLIYLAKCLVNKDIKLFLLDEPTVFLDFLQKDNLINIINSLQNMGKIIIFSCHDRDFIKQVATQILSVEKKQLFIQSTGR